MSSDTLQGQRSRDAALAVEWTPGVTVPDGVDDPFWMWRELDVVTEPGTIGSGRREGGALLLVDPVPSSAPARPVPSLTPDDLRGLADLEHSPLVLTEFYVGPDRRRPGRRGSVARGLHGLRRSLLRIEVLLTVAVVVTLVCATVVLSGRLQASTEGLPEATHPARAAASAVPAAPARSATPSSVPRTVTPPPAAASAPPATAPAAVPVAPAPVVDPSSPEAMGAAALALVRYPWENIPGYSIRFLPIGDAPAAGFYGNTDFTWGQTGGVSTLYVFPGESIDQLAGITAFEIGHEVDAAYVEPRGGHDQIAAILGVHPASWAPECDCAEQGYLSGWYAAAFSDYWSPGVGAWSSLAPPPSGAVLDAVRPWIDPSVP